MRNDLKFTKEELDSKSSMEKEKKPTNEKNENEEALNKTISKLYEELKKAEENVYKQNNTISELKEELQKSKENESKQKVPKEMEYIMHSLKYPFFIFFIF